MDDIHVNCGTYGSSPHEAKQSLWVRHFLSIEADDHVMGLYPSVGRRTLSHDLFDKDPRRIGRELHLYT